eukprot:scaffold7805_cov116-Isochrysis_galbana.AAC.14
MCRLSALGGDLAPPPCAAATARGGRTAKCAFDKPMAPHGALMLPQGCGYFDAFERGLVHLGEVGEQREEMSRQLRGATVWPVGAPRLVPVECWAAPERKAYREQRPNDARHPTSACGTP